jgi:hypothetical protein
MIALIEYSEGFLTFSMNGSAYQLDITVDMCSLSLGEEVECSQMFSCMNAGPCAKGYKEWHYPKPDELTEEEAATLAKEHYQLGRLLTQDELTEWAVTNPAYLSFLVNN